uniref:Omp85 domain-containing protein n=1 Tax=Haemonchus placei TaxID=6290 RepID=A0A0N4VYD1_HAEPC
LNAQSPNLRWALPRAGETSVATTRRLPTISQPISSRPAASSRIQRRDCLHSGGIAETNCGLSTSQFERRRHVRDISSPRAVEDAGDKMPTFGGGTPYGTAIGANPLTKPFMPSKGGGTSIFTLAART